MSLPSPAPFPNASATVRGVVTAEDQTFGGRKKQIDATLGGAPARRLLHLDVNVVDFGADPTGTADSQPAFVAALASVADGGRLIVPPGTYLFNAEWLWNGRANVELHGVHAAAVTLQAGTLGMRSVICLADGSDQIKISNVTIDAARKANFCLCLKGCTFGDFERLWLRNAVFDGMQAQRHQTNEVALCVNQFNRWWAVNTYRCGVYFATDPAHANGMAIGYGVQTAPATGTVSTTAGSTILTGSGTAFATLGLRAGDVVGVGADPLADPANYACVLTVDSNTQITLATPAIKSAVDQGYVIGRGGGFLSVVSGNCGLDTIIGGLHRSHAGSALGFGGLYGPTIAKTQIDFCATFGMRFAETGETPCYSSYVEAPYFEAIGSGAAIKSNGGQLVIISGIGVTVESRGTAQTVTQIKGDLGGMTDGRDDFIISTNAGVFLGLDVQNQAYQYALVGTSLADADVHPSADLLIVGTKLKDYANQKKKFRVRASGDGELPTPGRGLVLTSLDGSRFRLTVDNAGALVVVPGA